MMEALTWKGKIESYAKIKAVKKAAVAEVPDDQPELKAQVKRAMSDLVEVMTRETILRERKRLDGRAFDEVRPIDVEVGVLPRTHGSALFTRGETQALVTVTLGTSDDTQLIDDLEGEFEKKFMLHYNFPPFSVGEVKRFGSPGRREIGHGRLAGRSHRRRPPEGVPLHDPHRVRHPRVERLLLDGDRLRRLARPHGRRRPDRTAAVAGIAMGLVKEGDAWAVLTDIVGQEDHYGDMDFKVAGTRKGITALQMDIKISGIDREVFEKALDQAQGRPDAHPRQHGEGDPVRRGRRSRPTRRAS